MTSMFTPTHQRARNATTLFLFARAFRFFHVVQRNLCWRHFALLLATFFSTTSIASLTCSWRPQQVGRIDIGERGYWPVGVTERVKFNRSRTASLLNAEHLQRLLDDLLDVSLLTGNRMWSDLNVGRNMSNREAMANFARLSANASARVSPASLIMSKKTETWCVCSPIRLPKTNQWSPSGIITRNWREIQREPATRKIL